MKAAEDSPSTGASPPSKRDAPTATRMEAWLARRIARARMAAKGPWLVGFSHGPDSTLLLWLLARLAHRLPLPELVAVHVDHGLRPGSAAEAEAARRFAQRLGVHAHVARVTIEGRGEARARDARYAAFTEIARTTGAAVLLLAHHRDDDLETVIFRLLRGTGPLGLAGVPARRALDGTAAVVWRPLLPVPRLAIESAVRELRLPHLVDPSNADPAHTPRNRIRLELLPALRAKDPHDHAVRRLRREARALARAVERELRGVRAPRPANGSLRLPVAVLRNLSPWAQDLLWQRALARLGQPPTSRALLARLRWLAAAGTPSGKQVDCRRRWRATRTRDELCLQAELEAGQAHR